MSTYNGFNIRNLYSFERYPYMKEEVILQSFMTEIIDYDLPKEVLEVIKIAWNSRFWEKSGYDGATFVKDDREPRLDNFIHDFLYRSGYFGGKADIIYRELMMLTGYGKFKAYRRYYVIRLASPYFFIKHTINDNIKSLPFEVDDLYYKLLDLQTSKRKI